MISIVGGPQTFTPVTPVEPPDTAVLYVNTASSAGGNGTTNATSGANRAYASLREACAALTLIGTLSEPYTIYCEGEAADTLSVKQPQLNFITSPENYVHIMTTPENRHNGAWSPTKYRIEVLKDSGFYNNFASHIRLEGLQVQITVDIVTSTNYNCFRLLTANNVSDNIDHRFSNCLARGVHVEGGTGRIIGFIDSQSNPPLVGTVRRINCIAVGCYTGFDSASLQLTNYNCTAYGNEYGYGGTQPCVNCLGADNTEFDFLNVGASGHFNNASTDDRAPGTNSRINQTFTFVNAASGDFQLTSGDTGAKGFGLDDPGAGLFADDVASRTRTSPWDIGAHKAAS
jgi:hypothetical protein